MPEGQRDAGTAPVEQLYPTAKMKPEPVTVPQVNSGEEHVLFVQVLLCALLVAFVFFARSAGAPFRPIPLLVCQFPPEGPHSAASIPPAARCPFPTSTSRTFLSRFFGTLIPLKRLCGERQNKNPDSLCTTDCPGR